jgi:hypothetical protein
MLFTTFRATGGAGRRAAPSWLESSLGPMKAKLETERARVCAELNQTDTFGGGLGAGSGENGDADERSDADERT